MPGHRERDLIFGKKSNLCPMHRSSLIIRMLAHAGLVEEHLPDPSGAYAPIVAITTETDFSDPEPGRIAAAINDLLVRYGYPADRVNSWWNDSAYDALDGRTPTTAWLSGEYRSVWNLLQAAYAASEDAAKRLANDSSHAAVIERRIAELEQRYDS